MNRRNFIKGATVSAIAIPTLLDGAEESCCHAGHKGATGETGRHWSYRVYCYEREQGEWVFSKNARGSFAPEREYMTFDEEDDLSWNPHYAGGWMDGGVLHFQAFDDATDFVEMHVRAKDDINLIDSIYDVYYKNTIRKGSAEIQVAHYWFNGDTGSQIHWEADGFNRETGEGLTDWNKVEAG